MSIWRRSLQSLTFGDKFNQSMDNATLPSGLQSLTFGRDFEHLLDHTVLPNGIQVTIKEDSDVYEYYDI